MKYLGIILQVLSYTVIPLQSKHVYIFLLLKIYKNFREKKLKT